MNELVKNAITEAVPGSGVVRLGMDFGELPEIVAGGSIVSCTVSVSPTTTPPLTWSDVRIDGGYLVSAAFSGGIAGNYQVTFVPTLQGGQTLPPRVGSLILL